MCIMDAVSPSLPHLYARIDDVIASPCPTIVDIYHVYGVANSHNTHLLSLVSPVHDWKPCPLSI